MSVMVKNKTNKNYKRSQRGRSMVEMLGVLAIVGVLSVGGVYGYGVAMKKHKANELLHQASMLATTISAQAMTNDGKLPETITSFGNSSYGTFSTTVGETADKTGFTITISELDGSVCSQLKKGGMVQKVECKAGTSEGKVNAEITYYKNLATDPAEGEKSPTGGTGNCWATNSCTESEDPNHEHVCIDGHLHPVIACECYEGTGGDEYCLQWSQPYADCRARGKSPELCFCSALRGEDVCECEEACEDKNSDDCYVMCACRTSTTGGWPEGTCDYAETCVNNGGSWHECMLDYVICDDTCRPGWEVCEKGECIYLWWVSSDRSTHTDLVSTGANCPTGYHWASSSEAPSEDYMITGWFSDCANNSGATTSCDSADKAFRFDGYKATITERYYPDYTLCKKD